MYIVRQINITDPDSWIYKYCSEYTVLSWHLYNASLFRIRQCFTGWDKEKRTQNENEVFNELEILKAAYPAMKIKKYISYNQLDKIFRLTHNPDYFAGLPMQTAEAVANEAVQKFKNWLASLKSYKRNPEKFLGKPQMPGYKKSAHTFTITNQDAVLYGDQLKLPLTKRKLKIESLPNNGVLKEVKIIPYYGRFIVSLTFECDFCPSEINSSVVAGIDFGTDNFAAIVSTDGASRLYKGGAVLASNQFFAKKRAQAVSIITKGHEHMYATSRHLDNLSYHHSNFTRDQMHKISRSIINYCKEHNVSTLVLGVNHLWKQEPHMNPVTNQKFVQMPIAKLVKLITYKACMCSINVVLQEESYTSKASFPDMDYIPTYGKDDDNASFSGYRKKRGLYKTGAGLIVNADLNAAANIIRKALSCAWENNVSDFSFLNKPDVLGFHELNP